MSDKLKLYEERMKRLNNAVELKANDRVPIFALVDNWALFYSNSKLKDAKNDIEVDYAAYSKALTDFKFDASAFPAVTWPLRFSESLGGGIYTSHGEMETIQIATGQSEIMPASDYDKLIADPKGYILNTIIPKKHKIFQEGTTEEKFERFANSVGEFLKFVQGRTMLFERYKNEHGLPIVNAVPPMQPADLILDYLRDFKGTMSDIRRCPDKMAEACMALMKLNIINTYAVMPTPLYDRYINIFMHLPPFLKPKDFEKVYWPTFKAYVETFAAQGYKFMILFEKNYEHLYDYLQELPKGCILGMFEEDDLRKAKKALGKNICIGGGMRTNDLAFKTPQQCVDIAKGLIDDLAPGGGYVFSTDKILASMNDAKPECLRAVTDFVYEYGVYK
ncbi:MAG: hypothetical protein HGA49_10130 [Eubacteriaceae bacterium]|nr:hypothetical protein [Eubacteriaceae bacterium]